MATSPGKGGMAKNPKHRQGFDPMEEQRLRERLESRRKDLFTIRAKLDESWQDNTKPYVEPEETAQQLKIIKDYETIDTLERDELEQVDMALRKIFAGSYGICESCGKFINKRRLEAIPWTPLCVDCARREDRRQAMAPAGAVRTDVDPNIDLPPDFQGMADGDMVAHVMDTLVNDGRVELDELEVTAKHGILTLEGFLPSEEKHILLMEIIQDNLGIENVVDNVRAEPLIWQRPDRTPAREDDQLTEEEELLQGENTLDDTFHSLKSGKPMAPPDELIPEHEERAPRNPPRKFGSDTEE